MHTLLSHDNKHILVDFLRPRLIYLVISGFHHCFSCSLELADKKVCVNFVNMNLVYITCSPGFIYQFNTYKQNEPVKKSLLSAMSCFGVWFQINYCLLALNVFECTLALVWSYLHAFKCSTELQRWTSIWTVRCFRTLCECVRKLY